MTGHPATHTFIKEMAEEIRKRRVTEINAEMDLISYPPIGLTWVPSFLKQHPQLQTTLSRAIEISRIKTITRTTMREWFKDYWDVLKEHEIEEENVYNMDETGMFLAL